MPNSFLNIGSLQSLGSDDLNNDSTTAKDRPGRYAYLVDSFGAKVYMYARNTRGSAFAQGNLASRLADVAITNITAGSTTSATKASGWTANKHIGEILYVQDNDDTTGAAPEGEASIIGTNSASVVNVDPSYPFSVALAANDDLDTISPGWHLIAGAASDKAQEVKGVVVSKNGIADLSYGYVCCYGICPVTTLKASTAFTDRAAIIADTAAIAPDANGGWELVIGYKVGTVSSDIVGTVSPAFITVYAPTLNAGTP
jgi:hypothetical protein